MLHVGTALDGASAGQTAKSTVSVRLARTCLPPANTAIMLPFGATRPVAPITPRPTESVEVIHVQSFVSSMSTTAESSLSEV